MRAFIAYFSSLKDTALESWWWFLQDVECFAAALLQSCNSAFLCIFWDFPKICKMVMRRGGPLVNHLHFCLQIPTKYPRGFLLFLFITLTAFLTWWGIWVKEILSVMVGWGLVLLCPTDPIEGASSLTVGWHIPRTCKIKNCTMQTWKFSLSSAQLCT